jgi:hypothetical protein
MGTYSTATVNFIPPPHDHLRPQEYKLSVVPQPRMQPPTKNIPFTFVITVEHYTAYTITITAVNCDRRNSSSESFFLGNSVGLHNVS